MNSCLDVECEFYRRNADRCDVPSKHCPLSSEDRELTAEQLKHVRKWEKEHDL